MSYNMRVQITIGFHVSSEIIHNKRYMFDRTLFSFWFILCAPVDRILFRKYNNYLGLYIVRDFAYLANALSSPSQRCIETFILYKFIFFANFWALQSQSRWCA